MAHEAGKGQQQRWIEIMEAQRIAGIEGNEIPFETQMRQALYIQGRGTNPAEFSQATNKAKNIQRHDSARARLRAKIDARMGVVKPAVDVDGVLTTTMLQNKDKTCCLCRHVYEGFGNNAQPLKDGRCCDDCNSKVVLARILSM